MKAEAYYTVEIDGELKGHVEGIVKRSGDCLKEYFRAVYYGRTTHRRSGWFETSREALDQFPPGETKLRKAEKIELDYA